MKKIETHPSPEKLLRQVTEEAVNALALGGPDKIGDEAPMEAGVMLIAKAWGLPQESLQASLDLLAKERQLLRSESGAEGAQHEADDLRPDVLHLPGAVEADGARDIPQEAGNAEAHVAGVAVGRQHQGGDADDHAGEQDHAVLPEPVGFFHVFSS